MPVEQNTPDRVEQATVQMPAVDRPRARFRPDPARVACWLIPFALVVYLGMRRGGFEEQIRGPIGSLLLVLVAGGLLSWALPRARVSRLAWIGLGLIVAYGAWTTIGISWSASSGRSVTEAARVAAYAGAFAAAVLIGGRERLRTTAGAVGAACAVIAAIALLSRLHPAWFPDDPFAGQILGAEDRLRYPLGYWNALAGLVALGVPLIVWAATSARSLPLRGLAAAAMPVMALAIYFTYSRAGALTALIGVIAYVALSRRRLSLLTPIGVMAGISALVVWQGSRRDALGDAVGSSLARSQGDEMIVVALVGSLIIGVVVWGLAWAERRGTLPRAPEVPRKRGLVALGATALVLGVSFLGAGGIGYASDRFEQFKEPVVVGTDSARLASSGGNGRWQYWGSAEEAFETSPVEGIGPGMFEFWWNEHRKSPGVIRDAHSLFVENLGELGIVGVALIASFFLLVIITGARRALRAAGEQRAALAALTGASLAFTAGAAVDWLWELAVLPVAFMFIAAAILGTRDDDEDRERDEQPLSEEDDEDEEVRPTGRRAALRQPVLRGAGAIVAIAVAIAVFIPATAAQDLADSRNAFDAGNLDAALEDARSAAESVPFAGAPRYQEAIVFEENEEFARAATAAREATAREPTNWQAFYLLSRIQAERGNKRGAALVALRRAQELNRLNTLINPVNCNKPGNPCGIGETPEG